MAAGITFASINEQNVYLAAVSLKLEFDYQVPIDGGRGVRGGQVVDFIFYVPPQRMACPIQGKYWHDKATQTEDELKQARLGQLGYRVEPLFEEETMTVAQAVATIKRKGIA